MLRKILLSTVVIFAAAGAASAADLPNTKAPPAFVPPPPPPVFTWTGLYIGGQIGYEWGTSNTSAFVPGVGGIGLPNLSPSGVVGGAHVGYNYQMGQFVAGIEGDVNGSSYNATNTAFGLAYATRSNVDGSVRGRIGVAWDRALIYATGGVAFGGFNDSFGNIAGTSSLSTTRVGWTVGGGIEYAVDNNWSIRAEYRYTDYGRYTVAPAVIAPFLVSERQTDNRVQVGFSYKFDMFAPPAPVVAKY